MTRNPTDQAQKLREMMTPENSDAGGGGRVIAITSGKGGVGKSNLCINFALCLREQGQRVIVLDADVGFADVEVLLGVHPRYTLFDVLNGLSIWDAVAHDQTGLPFLSAGNGIMDIHDLTVTQMNRLLDELSKLQQEFDVILIDSGAGMGTNIGQLLSASDDIFLVTTPEPTSVADAYALVKMLSHRGRVPPMRMIVNRINNFVTGRETAEKLQLVISRFLEMDVGVLGYVLEDALVAKSVMNQTAVCIAYPDASATRCMRQLVRNYLQIEQPVPDRGIRHFFERLFHRESTSKKRDSTHSA